MGRAKETSGDTVPFGPLLEPLIAFATNCLLLRLDKAHYRPGVEIIEDMAQHLRQRLSEFFSQAFYIKFDLFRSGHRTTYSNSNQLFNLFLERFRDTGYRRFFSAYPMLCRVAGTLIYQWHENKRVLLERLSVDYCELRRHFQLTPEATLSQITFGHSDPHNSGATVGFLLFSDGRKLVYKPRTIESLKIWSQFLAWCSHRKILFLSCKTPALLSRDGYGWVEFVHHHHCDTRDELSRYYYRFGSLLAIAHMLNVTDLHAGNLVAAGEHPVVIDAETVCMPRLKQEYLVVASPSDLHYFADSVLATGMLPIWRTVSKGRPFDVSALASELAVETGISEIVWADINKDSMRPSRKTVHSPHYKNTTSSETLESLLLQFKSVIIRGFSDTAFSLLRHRSQVFSSRSPLRRLQDTSVRVIVRPTYVYNAILRKLSHPKFLGDGSAWSIAVDDLAQAYTRHTQVNLVSLLRAEHQSIDNLDVPRFELPLAPQHSYLTCPTVLFNACEKSGYTRAILKLETMSESDVIDQCRFIEAALTCRTASISRNRTSGEESGESEQNTPDWLEIAISLAHNIKDAVIVDGRHRLRWIGVKHSEVSATYQIELLDQMLYNGQAGLAIFLAQASRITSDPSLRELALGSLWYTEQIAHESQLREKVVREVGLGGLAGIGGLAYAASVVGELLAIDAPMEWASDIIRSIRPEHIEHNDRNDLVFGVAGLCLSVIAVHKRRPSDSNLEVARCCGDRLVRFISNTTGRPEEARSGVAHGLSGIAYALAMLYAETREMRFADACMEAVKLEDSLFNPTNNNWALARQHNNVCQMSWCNGAPGIGLVRSRIARLGFATTTELRVPEALECTARAVDPGSEIDNLCCGNFGVYECLHELAQHVNDVQKLQNCEQMLLNRCYHALKRRHFGVAPSETLARYTIGMFRGLSGVGYQLMRLGKRKSVSSILLME